MVCAPYQKGNPWCVCLLFFIIFALCPSLFYCLSTFFYLDIIFSYRIWILIFLLHRNSFSGFFLPFALKSSTFSPRWVGQDCLLFLWTYISPLRKGSPQKKRKSSLFQMSASIPNNDKIVRQAKWYLIICLEILTHLKGFHCGWHLGCPDPEHAVGVGPTGTASSRSKAVLAWPPLLPRPASKSALPPGSCCSDSEASRR